MKHAWLILVILAAGCTAPNTVEQNNTVPQVTDMNQIYESGYLATTKPFTGAVSNELYDVEIRLKSAGRINISENNSVTEYFRIDFNVTNHRSSNITFPYEANITESSYLNIKTFNSRPGMIERIDPNETKDGHFLFKDYSPKSGINIELQVAGGYRPYSYGRIYFRYSIKYGKPAETTLERVTMDISEENNRLLPGGSISVKIPSNGTYRYMMVSDRNVSVEVWPPGTGVDTIRFGNTTVNSTCVQRLQNNVTVECFLERNYLLTVKRIINTKARDLEGATVSLFLFKVIQINDTSLRYTGQATGRPQEEVFEVL